MALVIEVENCAQQKQMASQTFSQGRCKLHCGNSRPLFHALQTQSCTHEKSIMIGDIVNMEHCRWPDSSPSQSHVLRCLFDVLWYTTNELNLGIWHVALKLKLASHAKPVYFVMSLQRNSPCLLLCCMLPGHKAASSCSAVWLQIRPTREKTVPQQKQVAYCKWWTLSLSILWI